MLTRNLGWARCIVPLHREEMMRKEVGLKPACGPGTRYMENGYPYLCCIYVVPGRLVVNCSQLAG